MNTPGGRERLLELGVRNIPVLARGADYVFGQSLADVAKFVGVRNFQQQKLAPDVLIRKWLRVLSAAQRYIRQFPADSLDQRLIDTREYTIRHSGYHVFAQRFVGMKAARL